MCFDGKSVMMHKKLIWLCVLIVMNLPVYLVNCELFTATADLEKILYAEKDIAMEIRDYIQSEEARLEGLKKVAKDYEQHSHDALGNKEKYLSNPVNLYLLVKRFTVDWDGILAKYVTNDTARALLNKLYLKQDSFPNSEDLSGAISALLRLQDVYQIPAAKMANGDFLSKSSELISPELTALDCFELGKHAYAEDDFYHTLMWVQEAYDRYREEQNKTVDLFDVLDYLSFAAAKQGNTKYALRLTNELLEIDPYHQRAYNNKVYYEALLEQKESSDNEEHEEGDGNVQGMQIRNQRHIEDFRDLEEFTHYEKLCRGEDTHPSPKHLTCQYVHRKHPLLILNPAREETMHDKPRIVLYHNLLSESEIETVKQLATPKLGRATVQNAKTGQLETATYRISKSAWLKNNEHYVVQRISDRIEAVTGLDMTTAEELQVANYGIGGHYEPHFDFAREREKATFEPEIGNRIATMLFYMSDVDAGGATVFPHIGAKLFPRKGAGVFWYNLFRSGEGDLETRHAACPVLAGSKWVCNKWIHERGQEFRRPCSLNPDE